MPSKHDSQPPVPRQDVDAILFDVGKTLYRGKNRLSRASLLTRRALEQAGVFHHHLQDEDIIAAYRQATAVVRARYADTYFVKGGPRRPRSLWLGHNRQVLDFLNIENPRVADLIERQWEGCAPPLRPQPHVHAVLKTLSKRGYRLGVLSNTYRNHRLIFKDHGLDHFFELWILSFEVNLWKPNPGIFTLACDTLGLPAERVAYVGDKYDVDIEPAYALGMRSVLLEPERPPPEEMPSDVEVIRSLTELDAHFPAKVRASD